MSHSNEFLSGEADHSIGSMLGSLNINEQKRCNSNTECGTKIQVVEPSAGTTCSESDAESEDEMPPPLDSCRPITNTSIGTSASKATSTQIKPKTSTTSTSTSTLTNDKIDDGLSLMEKMTEEALKARKFQADLKNTKQRKNAKSASFSNFKKGFLNAPNKSDKKKGKKNSKGQVQEQGRVSLQNKGRSGQGENDKKIYELDSDGNLILETKDESERERNDIETAPAFDPSLKTSQPLHLQEVQKAMKDENAWQTFSNTEWSSPDLLDKISKNPKLLAGMADPKFTAALEALRDNPQEAMRKFKDHKDVTEFLNEFCSILGEHFTALGEKQQQQQQQQPIENGPSRKELNEEDVGPIAFGAIQREKERKARGEKSVTEDDMNEEEQVKYEAVMKDEELTKILMDMNMQKVLQECSTIPGKMQMYMRHEEYGMKLRKLIQAGLLRVA